MIPDAEIPGTVPFDDLPADGRYGPGALLTPANLITVLRLVLSPVLLVMIVKEPTSWAAVGFWTILAFTDGIDGYLARKHGTTRSGAFLDPLADKVLALGGLWAMVLAGRFWWMPVVLITLREALISAFRSYWGRRGLAVQASNVAKFKTFLQFSSVSLVVWPWTSGYTWMADTVLWLAVAVAWISAAQYIQAGSRSTTTMTR